MANLVLRLAPDLKVPAEEFIESATALIGKRGSGKSGGVKVIAEELFRVGLPFIVLDPVGVHWGIKSSFDGKNPGLPVLVIGGKHGDLRIDRRAGAAIARAVLEANVSCVIDFSQEPKAAYREFVRDFADEIYSKNESPRVVIIEEAPELVPQKVQADRAGTYEAVERLVSRGRNNAIGVVLISQRAATINKDVLTQVDNLFVGRLIGKPDRKALGEWIEAWGGEEKQTEFERNLPDLPTRTMWLWSPETLKRFQKVRFKDFKTLHADKTHLRRLGLLHVRPVTTDVSSVVAKLGKQMERLQHERSDNARVPKLEAEVQQLQSEVERLRTQKADPRATAQASIEAIRPYRERVILLESRLRAEEQAVKSYRAWLLKAPLFPESKPGTEVSDAVTGAARPPSNDLSKPAGFTALPKKHPKDTITAAEKQPIPYKVLEASGTPVDLGSGALRMLKELASRYPMTLTYPQLCTLCRYTPSGGAANAAFGNLRRNGFVTEDRDGNVRVTQLGLDLLGSDIPPAPTTHADVMDRWEKALPAPVYKILLTLVRRYPEWISKDDLAVENEFTASGGAYNGYLGLLRRNGLAETDGATIRAATILWPEAGAGT